MSDRVEIFQFEAGEPERLDKYLTLRLPEFSRARIQGLIMDGFVEVDGIPAKKAE